MAISEISFIGGGRISWLLLKSLHNKNVLPGKVLVADPQESMLQKVKAIAPERISCSTENKDAADAEVVFLAVHPPVVKTVIEELQGHISEKSILVSLAPVIRISKLCESLGCDRIVRMIPNAPSLLGSGYNPVVFSAAIPQSDRADLLALFSHWGATPEVDERKLEAYAIISAMGPTYFWFQWQKLQRLGQQFGLTETELRETLPAMLRGAVATMYESGLAQAEVIDLIPVRPIKEHEGTIGDIFIGTLTPLFQKLSPR